VSAPMFVRIPSIESSRRLRELKSFELITSVDLVRLWRTRLRETLAEGRASSEPVLSSVSHKDATAE
jgi:hypothetical protein